MALSVFCGCRASSVVNAREVMLEGRPYLVTSLVIFVEGVHCGSGGPLFYSAHELERSVEGWNGRVLPIFHPERGGKFVTANSPEEFEGRKVGQIFGARYDGLKRGIVGDAWIDVEACRRLDPGLLSVVRSGRPVEVSPGMIFDLDGVSGEWNGEAFGSSVLNIVPDHCALLPGGRGACSLEDGCGLNVNVGDNSLMKANPFGQLHRIFAGIGRELFGVRGVVVSELSRGDLEDRLQVLVSGLDEGGRHYFVHEVFGDHVITACHGMDLETGEQLGTRYYDQRFEVGGELGLVLLGGGPLEVRRESEWVRVGLSNQELVGGVLELERGEEGDVKVRDLVMGLIAHEKSPFTVDDSAVLESFGVERLVELASGYAALQREEESAALVVSVEAAKLGGGVGGGVVTVSSWMAGAPLEIQSVVSAALAARAGVRAARIETICGNVRNPYTRVELEGWLDSELEKLSVLAAPPVDYSGAGGVARAQLFAHNDVPEMPKVFDDKRSVPTA